MLKFHFNMKLKKNYLQQINNSGTKAMHSHQFSRLQELQPLIMHLHLYY